ncbi:LLM class flavin-dependent oxidoreductase [soil metagenome]
MKFGLFLPPYHPKGTPIPDACQWDLDLIVAGDRAGLTEAWVGEHFTVAWEPVPCPDILLALAIRDTENIKLAPGAHLLAYHHLAELAMRISYLDQRSGGRYMVGIGAGAYPSDAEMMGITDMAVRREMVTESLDIMRRLWTAEEPFTYTGKYWSAALPEYDDLVGGPHLRPFQDPHPPIGMAGFSASSSTLRTAGEIGAFPLSLCYNAEYLASHWDAFVEGAEKGGHPADRDDWRIAAHVFVAETDKEALEYAVDSPLADVWLNYEVEVSRQWGALGMIGIDEAWSKAEILDFMAKERWLVGSPETVAQKVAELHETTGGFGTMLTMPVGDQNDGGAWRRSVELMGTEVAPRLSALTGSVGAQK